MNTRLHDDAPLAYLRLDANVRPRRLLVLAHGVGGNETNLAGLGAQAPEDTAVVLPRAPLAIGHGQYAWFAVAFTESGPQPDFAAETASRRRLADFIEATRARLGVPAAATVVAGFSQGGIMSAGIALTRPERLAGFGVLSGRVLPELEPHIATRDALAHLRAFVGHGREDTKLPVAWAQRADDWLTRLGIAHDLHLYPGGHAITPAMQADFLAWFDATTRA